MSEDMIEAMEKATGPDRGLDAEIAKLLGWKLWRSKHGYWNVEGPSGERHTTSVDPFGPKFDPETGKKNPDYDREPTDWVFNMDIPEYTSSIDAAITLVPESYFWIRKCIRTMTVIEDRDYDAEKTWAVHIDGGHTNPAIALCIAALKARRAAAALKG